MEFLNVKINYNIIKCFLNKRSSTEKNIIRKFLYSNNFKLIEMM